ncbi:MAG: insulinase family protein, partial [Planctomycetota bacterium]
QMYLDQPPFGMDDRVKQLCFGGHPITRSVLGTAESIEALTAGQMRDYFNRRYGPSTMLIAGAGRIDFDALVDQIGETCGDWAPADRSRDVVAPHAEASFESVHQHHATQQYVLRLAAAPDAADPDRYAAKLLATVVGDDSGSRLYWELVDPGHAESASLGHYEYEGVGMYYAWMSCDPDAVEPDLAAMQRVFDHVQRDGVAADELDQARSKVRSRVVLGGERPRSRLFSVGGNWLQRQEYRSVRDDLGAIDSITAEDVRRVLDRFPLDSGAVVTVGPRETVAPPA